MRDFMNETTTRYSFYTVLLASAFTRPFYAEEGSCERAGIVRTTGGERRPRLVNCTGNIFPAGCCIQGSVTTSAGHLQGAFNRIDI